MRESGEVVKVSLTVRLKSVKEMRELRKTSEERERLPEYRKEVVMGILDS